MTIRYVHSGTIHAAEKYHMVSFNIWLYRKDSVDPLDIVMFVLLNTQGVLRSHDRAASLHMSAGVCMRSM